MNKTEAAKILGLQIPFTAKQAKTAYRKLAMKNHPDKGGCVNKMAGLNDAYTICSSGVEFGGSVDWSGYVETVFRWKRPELKISTVVNWFSMKMLNKLNKNSVKGFTWRRENADFLLQRMTDEVLELAEELGKDEMDKGAIISECADVANFAMFIADKAERQL